MKSENILADIKSKSLKEAKEEISQILSKLENKDINLEESVKDYERLIKLNNHINELLRIKVKKISSVNKK
jgi:exodeoxyribonuclease VII small subunit